MIEHKSLAEAQLAVMEEVSYVQKQNIKGLSYAVATESDVIAALRPAMIKHGITSCPVAVAQMDSGRWETKTGGAMNMIRLAVTYRFTHVPTKEFLDIQVVGEAANVSDKGSAAAMTQSQKYSLLEFFLLERGTDPDVIVDHRSDENKEVFRNAYSSLQKCATEGVLDRTLENIRSRTNDDGTRLLTDDQVDELAMYAEQFRRKIRDVSRREA